MMRLKRVPCREIEAWLIQQGKDYRISYPTISRNLKKAGVDPNLSYGEEQIEAWGGDPTLNLTRELSAQILAQKNRVDRLIVMENGRNKGRDEKAPYYIDRRIAREMELLKGMIADHHKMIRENEEKEKGDVDAKFVGIVLTKDAEQVLTEMLLGGEIKLNVPADSTDSPKYH